MKSVNAVDTIALVKALANDVSLQVPGRTHGLYGYVHKRENSARGLPRIRFEES